MFLLFHFLERFHSLKKNSFTAVTRSFIFLGFIDLSKIRPWTCSLSKFRAGRKLFLKHWLQSLFLVAESSSEVQGLLPHYSLFPLSIWPTAPAPAPSFLAGVLCNKMLFPLRVLPFLLLPGWGVMSSPVGTDICWTLSTPLGQAGFWLVVQEFMGFFFLCSRWACGSAGPPDPSTSFLFLGTQFIHCFCWDLDLKVIDECALQQSYTYIYVYIYIYSLGNMPDVQLTVVLLIQKPLLIELWNCFLDAACWNLWDSLFIGDDYLQRT